MNKKKPIVVVIDIETAPLESYTWGLWKQNVGLNQIKTEWSILSFAAKDLGVKKVRYHDASGRGAHRVRDDEALLQLLRKELDRADIVIAQNGRRFDVKKINARMIMAGYKPYSPITIVDTLEQAKSVAAFTSNKLEWMAAHLTEGEKDKHKEFPGFELWSECLKDNPRAWAAMRKYNIPDIQRCEDVYLKLRPWAAGHPNVAAYNSTGEVVNCPKCGSENVAEKGSHFTPIGNEYIRYHCGGCGGYSRSRYTHSTIERRRSLLGN